MHSLARVEWDARVRRWREAALPQARPSLTHCHPRALNRAGNTAGGAGLAMCGSASDCSSAGCTVGFRQSKVRGAALQGATQAASAAGGYNDFSLV